MAASTAATWRAPARHAPGGGTAQRGGRARPLAKIRTTHARALEDVIYQIKAIEGVVCTTSTVVLNTEFEDRPLDLEWMGADKAGR